MKHQILFSKLEYYGVRGIVLNWFIDYLANRKQRVTYNSTDSDDVIVNYGVPQGSILGQLLFLVYMNDFNCTSILFKVLLYADDIAVCTSGDNINTLIQSLNEELYNINNWIIANRLSLNIAKSNFIIFHSPKKVILYDSPPSTNNIDLIRVTSFRYLGIILDEHLSWLDHIKHRQGRIARNIGIIARIRPFVSTKTALLLYFPLIYPYLT